MKQLLIVLATLMAFSLTVAAQDFAGRKYVCVMDDISIVTGELTKSENYKKMTAEQKKMVRKVINSLDLEMTYQFKKKGKVQMSFDLKINEARAAKENLDNKTIESMSSVFKMMASMMKASCKYEVRGNKIVFIEGKDESEAVLADGGATILDKDEKGNEMRFVLQN